MKVSASVVAVGLAVAALVAGWAAGYVSMTGRPAATPSDQASVVPPTAPEQPAKVPPPPIPTKAELIQAAREAVRKQYKDQKKVPSADLSYFIDTSKLKDSRWQFSDTVEPTGVDDGRPMFHATFGSGNATDPKPSIDCYVWRSPHFKDEGGGRRSVYSHAFKAWGKVIELSNVMDMATGYYEDFLARATEVEKDHCKPASKKAIGEARYWGCAVGKFKDEGDTEAKRVRRDWYLWVESTRQGQFTWLAQFTTSAEYIDNEEWIAKIPDLVKNLKELKDPRLK